MSDANWMQECVRAFHKLTNNPAPTKLTTDFTEERLMLRASLILEEAFETVGAMGLGFVLNEDDGGVDFIVTGDPDWPEVIDGLCDLVYVSLGLAVEMGISLNPFFREVHRSNMTKGGGPVRADGKSLKPEGWEPPRIKYLLDRLSDKESFTCVDCGVMSGMVYSCTDGPRCKPCHGAFVVRERGPL